jgi:threonine dehydrogenase-like Zn-dependent dehydrogenase
MRASFLVGSRNSVVQEVVIPSPKQNEVLIRVEACGVCASDIHRWLGSGNPNYPERIGHEPSGVVEGVGNNVDRWKKGQPVTALAPGSGAFAEFITVPEDRVTSIPSGLTFTEAIAEPVGCLVSGLERVEINPECRVAVVGCGFMGLALIQLIASRGVREIAAVDIRKDALKNALRFGAKRVFFPDEVDTKDKVVRWDQIGQGFDVVFESTGTQAALTLAGEMTGVHGTLSIVGWHANGMRSVDIGLWNWKAITVINAHERRMDYLVSCMETGLELIAAKKLDMSSLVTHEYTLDEIDKAFGHLENKPEGYIKGVVLPQT